MAMMIADIFFVVFIDFVIFLYGQNIQRLASFVFDEGLEATPFWILFQIFIQYLFGVVIASVLDKLSWDFGDEIIDNIHEILY